ncbi:MAG: hypothetical protein Q9220_003461 [cf. Caloplaca sp. 1 TL-2023]
MSECDNADMVTSMQESDSDIRVKSSRLWVVQAPTRCCLIFTRELLDRTVTIQVGSAQQKFDVHKALLRHESDYFRAALTDRWKEGQEGVVTLKNENPKVFHRFVLWIYFGKIIDDNETLEDISWDLILKCYFQADRLGISKLGNCAIDTLIMKQFLLKQIPTNCQQYIYEKTIEGSLLRKMLIDSVVLLGAGALLAKELEEDREHDRYDKDFLMDVIVAKYKQPKTIGHDAFFKKRCKYHVHKEGEALCTE